MERTPFLRQCCTIFSYYVTVLRKLESDHRLVFHIPRGKSAEEATSDVIERQLPAIAELKERGELQVDNVDVFCEKGVFNVEQTRRILKAGNAIGLVSNFHGEELNCLNSAEV